MARDVARRVPVVAHEAVGGVEDTLVEQLPGEPLGAADDEVHRADLGAPPELVQAGGQLGGGAVGQDRVAGMT